MTFKDLKKLVELPSYKEQRVPTVKALEVSGVPVVAEKILENHGSISVYQNGYVIYRAHVGNGMMIHCGDPISYTSINSTYWQNHFLGFGRIK